MPEQTAASAACPSSDPTSVNSNPMECSTTISRSTGHEDRTTSLGQAAKPTKSEVIQTLHAMIHERLFGTRSWRADRETGWAVDRKLKALGLNEPVPGMPNAEQATPLGRELNIDLMQVFIGFWDPCEIPLILEDHGLISEDEILEVEERCEDGEDPEAVLLPLVRRAFFQHFQAGARVN
jgi:hypothetical protein